MILLWEERGLAVGKQRMGSIVPIETTVHAGSFAAGRRRQLPVRDRTRQVVVARSAGLRAGSAYLRRFSSLASANKATARRTPARPNRGSMNGSAW